MAKQNINLGTAPTGTGGDTPRTAFQKAIENFDELYAAFAAVYSALGASGSPIAFPTALPISKGGTGGSDKESARTGLGLGSVAVESTVPVAKGGTGGTDQSSARTGLGLGSVAVENTVPLAKGGTGVGSIAALLSALQAAGAFGKSNILGTVSQTSGLPTGAIIEQGSNANGYYTKFADGTLICRRQLLPDATVIAKSAIQTYTLTMPAAFIDMNFDIVGLASANTSADIYGCIYSYPVSATSFTMLVRNGAGSTNTFSLGFIAIGRWF